MTRQVNFLRADGLQILPHTVDGTILSERPYDANPMGAGRDDRKSEEVASKTEFLNK